MKWSKPQTWIADFGLQRATRGTTTSWLVVVFDPSLLSVEGTLVCVYFRSGIEHSPKCKGMNFGAYMSGEEDDTQGKECWLTAASWHQRSRGSARRVFPMWAATCSFASKQDAVSAEFFQGSGWKEQNPPVEPDDLCLIDLFNYFQLKNNEGIHRMENCQWILQYRIWGPF